LTEVDESVFAKAREKKLKLYVEYPSFIPGIDVGKPRGTVWERVVVSSDAFGSEMPKFRIVAVHDCHFTPVSATDPIMVVARVAGYNTAVYGLPEEAYPILFELSDKNVMIATTKLSGFVTGRYAPTQAWKVIWEQILNRLNPAYKPSIEWDPTVHPAYLPDEKLPKDAEKQSLKLGAKYYREGRILIHPSRKAEINKLLITDVETMPVPGPEEPQGDGSLGMVEGYAAGIKYDGNQPQRAPIRADCHAEAAMVLAIDAIINGNEQGKTIAKNLLDFVYFTSDMCGGDRGNPKHPAFGHVAWGGLHPAWMVANYGDDNARVLLGTMAAAACLGSDRWDESMLRALLANLRTTGKLGFRTDRIDMPDITKRGWKSYYDDSPVNYAPHFESYLWACYLWAYQQTNYKPFLEKTKTGIKMMMEAYPEGWRWKDSIERARMLLCLSWLIRLEDTPEHRGWLKKIAKDLLEVQQPCGALQERLAGMGGGHYVIPPSNEAYGTGETPLIQQNSDPASDQLYTTGFALLGLHEAVAATGDPELKEAEDKLTDFLVRIQVRSDKYPYLDGSWFRAFDFKLWDYWASSADIGWGAWSVESGWGQAWIAAVLGLRAKNTSLWDLTSESRIENQFDKVQEQMSQNDGSPFELQN
jgi:hypothetical protein